jgi:hypothetical protein
VVQAARRVHLTHEPTKVSKSRVPREVALAAVKDDHSKYSRLAVEEEIVITRHGRPAGALFRLCLGRRLVRVSDSEALDFRAASESFAGVRKLTRRDLETLRLVTQHQGRIVNRAEIRSHPELGTGPQDPKRRHVRTR